ncbi:increased DNA methylation 1-like [Henckelia pumila]|uniref:increased DNA methylation 1-like n=1 Tax=Henckelia pumila TaxID=405737 RepID=UPI003C6E1876
MENHQNSRCLKATGAEGDEAHPLQMGERRRGRGKDHERDMNQQNPWPQDLGFSTRRKRSSLNRRAMKPNLLSWLIDTNTIQENAAVFPLDDTEKEGMIKREGILCSCCNNVFTAAEFLVHIGKNEEKPYENIYVAHNQASLLSCLVEAWNKPRESECHRFNMITESSAGDAYDDACMICADGGDLMCCEQCNSTYHQACMSMEMLLCVDHWECHFGVKEKRNIDLNVDTPSPFCDRSCKEVYEKLTRDMVGQRNELDEGFSWTLLHQMSDGFGMYISDKYLRTMCHSKLGVARRLMEECFEPIKDRYTKIKVIPSVVYNCGSNFKRVDFKGFYTAVLEKNDEIITVASLRIHGTNLAEMPFIATSEVHRCKGMCKKLMVAIESALYNLNVENLVITSVPERTNKWIEGYGFHHLHASMKREIMLHNTITFHDSIRLQKILKSPRIWHVPGNQPSSSTDHGGLVDRSKSKSTILDWILKPPA